jgi:hypothetical protein
VDGLLYLNQNAGHQQVNPFYFFAVGEGGYRLAIVAEQRVGHVFDDGLCGSEC